MVCPHDFGDFAGRAGRNVFTLQDLDNQEKSKSQSSSYHVPKVQKSSPSVIERKSLSLPLVYGILLSVSCLVHAVSVALLLGAGILLQPVILAAVILQALMTISIIACLAWTSCKFIYAHE